MKLVNRDYPTILTTTNYNDVLKNQTIDCVVIATPVHTHYKLAKQALKQSIKSELIIGAKSKQLLLYIDKEYPKEVIRHYCTDEGSYGFKGFTTEKLKEILNNNNIDMVYTVGPEIMMKKVVEICDEFNVDCQLSLERYMKCGYGICGSCSVDPMGIRMCKEGPCIDKETAKIITEFGKYHRDRVGRKQEF